MYQEFNTNIAALVDVDLCRARKLADSYGVPCVLQDYRELPNDIDAAIIGLPHAMHAPAALALLERGIHVLVEKPMALTVADCDAMIAASQHGGAMLGVGLLRRFAPNLKWVKLAIEQGVLGEIQSFELREGDVYRWPVASGAMFRPGAGGVLADAGAHALDLILWWLGEATGLRYFDDACGGVEADCRLELIMQNGATGVVELSRLREMPNTCVLRGTRGTLTVGTKTDSTLSVTLQGSPSALTGKALAPGATPPSALIDLFRLQLEDFLTAIRGGRALSVPATEGRRGVALIEQCYAIREPLIHSWEGPPAAEDVDAVA
jgi:predicted dehydrogenase